MSAPVVRALGPDEVEAVHDIWRRAGLGFRPTGRDALEALRREAAGPRSFVLGAFVDGLLVGAAVGTDDGRKGWINRVGVVPEHTRGTIGTALVRACEERFRERGIGLFAVLVADQNEASLRLFRSAGYTLLPEVRYLRKPDAGEDW